MTTATIEVPHVYTALAGILKSLSVPKGGVLPGNMGGKPYITAVDAAAEVKRQFVDNDLIFLPNEEVIKHENIVTADRAVKITIVIKGTYTIISTVDGSQVTISGIGDGLANGTAVASNIGSTNALKNALLRVFLITEQSVEDAAKSGPAETTPSAATRALDNARNTSTTPPSPRGKTTADQDKIRVNYIESGKMTPDEVNNRFKAIEAKNAGKRRAEIFSLLLKELEAE